MSYQHIDNLYKNQDVLLFKEVYALEKIHGTSAHVRWRDNRYPGLEFFSGGANRETFLKLFDHKDLEEGFKDLGVDRIVVHGEAYGGKCQGMKETYGPDLRFVAFEVKIGDSWLSVPDAEGVTESLGLEFVHYEKGPATIEWLDQQRDAPSEQHRRNRGFDQEPKPREGIVIRPLIELTKNNGKRVMAKHKGEQFRETATTRKVSKERLQELTEATAIADEWVTEMRMAHVLDKIQAEKNQEGTIGSGVAEPCLEWCGEVIKAMVEDVLREGEGEFENTKPIRKAIGHRAVHMFKDRLKAKLHEGAES